MNPSARPEARWALWSGVLGALVTTALSVKGIFASGSSTAALGFITLPLVAALGAIPVAAWGAALGHVVLRWRGKVQSPPMVLVAALAVAAALPVAVGAEILRGLRLESAVREVRGMDVAQLGRAFEDSPFRRDRYFLGAIAQNPAAQGDVLARIAALRDPEFYEPMGSLGRDGRQPQGPRGDPARRAPSEHRCGDPRQAGVRAERAGRGVRTGGQPEDADAGTGTMVQFERLPRRVGPGAQSEHAAARHGAARRGRQPLRAHEPDLQQGDAPGDT